MDYGAVSTFLMFDSCEMESCTNITIVDDMVLELLESFSITLERTTGNLLHVNRGSVSTSPSYLMESQRMWSRSLLIWRGPLV